jgi:hypothetical protein
MMQVSNQVYPLVAYPYGIPYKVSISFTVPSAGMPITIEKVHLVGKDLFMLCSVNDEDSAFCVLGLSKATVTVSLPQGTNTKDIKVHRYVLGATWGWSDETHRGIHFIESEKEFL